MDSTIPNQRSALRARWLFPVTGAPIPDGVLTLNGCLIEDVGTTAPPGVAVVDLGNCAVLPAFVNAHTHLEFSGLSQPFPYHGDGFVNWLRAVIAWRESSMGDASELTAAEAVMQGRAELLATGTLRAGDIRSASTDLSRHDATCVTGIEFQEWIGLQQRRTAELLAAFEQRTQTVAHSLGWQLGISPHAPYTASWQLVEGAVACARRWGLTLAMHLAESSEEMELLASHSGELLSLLTEREIWDASAIPRGIGPQDYLQLLSQAPRALIIHGNLLGPPEWSTLATHSGHMTLVHCPRTHAYFRRTPFPLQEILAAGVHVAIGTDSRGSNPDLNMLAEGRQLSSQHAAVSDADILSLITMRGAEALGAGNEIGCLSAGRTAELVALALPDVDPPDPHQLLWHPESRVCRVWHAGQAVSM